MFVESGPLQQKTGWYEITIRGFFTSPRPSSPWMNMGIVFGGCWGIGMAKSALQYRSQNSSRMRSAESVPTCFPPRKCTPLYGSSKAALIHDVRLSTGHDTVFGFLDLQIMSTKKEIDSNILWKTYIVKLKQNDHDQVSCTGRCLEPVS